MLCHKELRKIAKGIAGAAYEQFAKDDLFYKNYPDQNAFIERHWKNYVGHARNAMIQMLSDTSLSTSMKDEVAEIIFQDRTLQAVNNLAAVQGTA